jgi:hypothetical protein
VVKIKEVEIMKGLSFKEFQKIALENYNNGGDSFYECWEERDFNEYVEEFGPITKTKFMKMIKTQQEVDRELEAARRWYSGEDY